MFAGKQFKCSILSYCITNEFELCFVQMLSFVRWKEDSPGIGATGMKGALSSVMRGVRWTWGERGSREKNWGRVMGLVCPLHPLCTYITDFLSVWAPIQEWKQLLFPSLVMWYVTWQGETGGKAVRPHSLAIAGVLTEKRSFLNGLFGHFHPP